MVNANAVKVFKKAAPNGKVTAYLSNRDFVDHVDHCLPVDGVLVVDKDFLKGKQVFARVAVTYRYGREDDEMMGMSFCKEFIIVNDPIGPGTKDVDQINDVQEKLVKKLGEKGEAYPFKVKLPENSPASVTLEGGDDGGASLGVSYDLIIYTGEGVEENPNKGNSIAFAIRKVQYAPNDPSKRKPQAMVSKGFTLSKGELKLEVTLAKDIYLHGDNVVASVNINNGSKKTVKNIKVNINQHIEVTMTNNQFIRTVASIESKEGCPITPGRNLEKDYTLVPSLSNNKKKTGIALDGCLKDHDANLASSTMHAKGKDANDALGIIVAYSLQVKVSCGAIAGELKADVPFKMVHPDPSVARKNNEGALQVADFKTLRRGKSIADD
ncbi:unnamed protein product [Meganyctiphanes norvegica]|uniref:Arrestin C-terminal-like domain-containing protein n=1 Tax=Meganyctiphanes norvegica TaxID=48144 RepID=A0AAV2S5D2_MEGNR